MTSFARTANLSLKVSVGEKVPRNLPLSPAPLLAGVLLRNFTWKHKWQMPSKQGSSKHGGSQHSKIPKQSVSASNALLEAPNQTATDLEDEDQHSVLCLLGLLPYMTAGSRNCIPKALPGNKTTIRTMHKLGTCNQGAHSISGSL